MIRVNILPSRFRARPRQQPAGQVLRNNKYVFQILNVSGPGWETPTMRPTMTRWGSEAPRSGSGTNRPSICRSTAPTLRRILARRLPTLPARKERGDRCRLPMWTLYDVLEPTGRAIPYHRPNRKGSSFIPIRQAGSRRKYLPTAAR